MVLKDWHKDGKYIWYSYDSRGQKKSVFIKNTQNKKYPYYFGSQNAGLSKWKYFKTKSAALKSIRAWMKKH